MSLPDEIRKAVREGARDAARDAHDAARQEREEADADKALRGAPRMARAYAEADPRETRRRRLAEQRGGRDREDDDA
jgi:hypothetical protein